VNGSRRPKALLAFEPQRYRGALDSGVISRFRVFVDLARPEPVDSFSNPLVQTVLGGVEVLVTGWGAPEVTREVLEQAPALRLIAHVGGSVKGLIDQSAWERGIAVTSAVAANAGPVAEYTLGAILLANKRAFELREAYRAARSDQRAVRETARDPGNYGKTIGIVGASHVGRRLIELLAPFDYTVLLYDPYVSEDEARELRVRLAGLDELLSTSDVVSLHAPATAETRHMLDARRLALLRDGTVLVNTARAALVDEEALIAELRSGRIAAVLDVTEPEPPAKDSPLYDLPNVFLTPHIAGAVGSERRRLFDAILAEIERYVHGEALCNRVDAALLERLA
jgi:phosphoglycerate dehydrogenase-like enzyme